MIAPEKTPYLAAIAIGVIAGLGMLFVKPAPGEPEKLDRVFPMAQFYQYAPVRKCFAFICFGFASLGLAFLLGWL